MTDEAWRALDVKVDALIGQVAEINALQSALRVDWRKVSSEVSRMMASEARDAGLHRG